MDKMKVVGIIVVLVIVGYFGVRGCTADEVPVNTLESATNVDECATAGGSWVDTATEAGCIAASGEWKESDCSIPSYCEPVVQEEQKESSSGDDTNEPLDTNAAQ